MLDEVLARHGLFVMACLAAESADGVVEAGVSSLPTLVLIGHAGSSLWPYFIASPEYRDGLAEPLDRWSRRIGDDIARRFGGRAVYPFDGPPFHPFQRWAMRAHGLRPSPLGVLIHPRYGPWHAYRFALFLPDGHADAGPGAARQSGPDAGFVTCDTCAAPCLAACPAGAIHRDGMDFVACLDHLNGDVSHPCVQSGCGAREACPVGDGYRYVPLHARFHMLARVGGHPVRAPLVRQVGARVADVAAMDLPGGVATADGAADASPPSRRTGAASVRAPRT